MELNNPIGREGCKHGFKLAATCWGQKPGDALCPKALLSASDILPELGPKLPEP